MPYLSLSNFHELPLDDVNALGKTMFIAMIGVVSLEVALVSRFWTGWFVAAWLLSWALCFPWLILLGMIYSAIRAYDSAMARRPRPRAPAVLAQQCAPGPPRVPAGARAVLAPAAVLGAAGSPALHVGTVLRRLCQWFRLVALARLSMSAPWAGANGQSAKWGGLHAPCRRGGLQAGGVAAGALANIISVVQPVQERKHISRQPHGRS